MPELWLFITKNALLGKYCASKLLKTKVLQQHMAMNVHGQDILYKVGVFLV
jgi:hypothetical protein